ncbi:MAG: CotH kinase family protein [Clostridia bacterium]|nr:CotH kinase family protein [Clostridia bacterium]
MDVKRYTPCNIGRTINRPIMLGKVGEINALRIEFGCEEWLTDYPNATVDLYVKRPDNDGYHAAMGEDGYNRIWIIDERALLTAGNGTIELILKDAESGTKIKSETGYTTVAYSPSAGDEPSDLGFIAYNRQQNLTEAQKRVARTNIGAGTGSGDGTGGGTDGFSPTIEVVPITGGHRLIITDVYGEKTVDVMDGKAGEAGAAGAAGRGIVSVVRTSGNGSAGSTDTYTITYTDNTTSKITVYNGKDGADGTNGVSPIIAVETISGGHRVTITDVNGFQSFDVMDGEDGQDGAAGEGASVELDTTLTQSGKAADAKATGDELNELKEANAKQDNRLTALEQAGGIVTVEPAQDDVPIVFFGGDLPQTKTDTVMPFKYVSKTKTVSGYVETKAQGNSSMGYPKKNQTVKMYADEALEDSVKVDFKGWGAQKKHVYKANWIDLTHARNIVSAQLWGDVVKSRANYNDLPELLRTSPNQGAVDGFPVLVYANNIYQGRYTLNIPKDAWMANMDDSLDEHCILCGENYVSGCFRAAANIDGSDWTDEVHDTVPAAIKTRWNEVISFVMNSTDEEFKANLSNYFYTDSLIDYLLFGLAICDLDGFGKNQIFLTYDGQKWIASAYDKDATFGLYWSGSQFVATDYPRTSYEDYVSTSSNGDGNLLYIRLEKNFYSEIQARWEELKAGALSYSNIMTRFERFIGIVPPHIVKEDYASTTGGGSFTGIPSQNTNHIQQIRSFAIARQTWTDEYVAALTPAEEIPCTGITLDQDTMTFIGAGTQTLTATVTPSDTTDAVTWSSDDSSIASVSNGVVTAKANGSATITATCGEYNATCAVTVSGIETGGDTPSDDVLYENYAPNGEKFSKSVSIDWDTQKIVANLDMTNQTPYGNVLSVGLNIDSWSGYNIHMYGRETLIEVNYLSTGPTGTRLNANFNDASNVLIEITKDGVIVDGTPCVDSGTVTIDVLNAIADSETVIIGSMEGTKRSDSVYKYVAIEPLT